MIPSWIRRTPVVQAGRACYRNWVSWRRARSDPAEQWRRGIADEIQFWEHWLETKGGGFPIAYTERLNRHGTLLDDFIARHLPPDQPHIRILDVGSGPVSSLGFPRSPDGRPIELTAADALGRSYGELLHRYGVEPSAWPIPVAVEELSTQFDDGVFDLVFCSNALDHSVNPLLGIRQMLRVVRPGCYVILTHEQNVAEAEGYAGLHGWNFDERNERLKICRGSSEIDVGQVLNNAEVSAFRKPSRLGQLWIYASIRRLPELHADLGLRN